jgi:hypothetical protein
LWRRPSLSTSTTRQQIPRSTAAPILLLIAVKCRGGGSRTVKFRCRGRRLWRLHERGRIQLIADHSFSCILRRHPQPSCFCKWYIFDSNLNDLWQRDVSYVYLLFCLRSKISSNLFECKKLLMKNRKGRFFFSSFFNQNQHIVGYRISVIRHGDPLGSLNTTPNISMSGFGAGSEGIFPEIPAWLKQKRKRKLELSPKVPFANERTLRGWFHWAILLSGSSMTLSSFHTVEDQPLTQIYGLILIPWLYRSRGPQGSLVDTVAVPARGESTPSSQMSRCYPDGDL